MDLEDGELYTVRLRTKTSLPERLQATGLKILGIYDADGTRDQWQLGQRTGAAGKKVFLTDWTAPSTGRFYIAEGNCSEGSEGTTDRTGTYWLSLGSPRRNSYPRRRPTDQGFLTEEGISQKKERPSVRRSASLLGLPSGPIQREDPD